MSHQIERSFSQSQALVGNGTALSGAIDMRAMAGGALVTPASLNATTVIAFKVSQALAGAYVPVYKADNSLLYLTVQLDAARGYALPTELFAWPFVKVWCATSAGVDVAQTGDKVFEICLKG